MIDLNKRHTDLTAYLGQLIDLKAGKLKDIIITRGKHADFLAEIIMEEIERINLLKKEADEYEVKEAEEIERIKKEELEEDEKCDFHPRPEEVK